MFTLRCKLPPILTLAKECFAAVLFDMQANHKQHRIGLQQSVR